MSKDKSSYSIGYKKPPRQSQFKPGQSGNPAGRPKKNFMTLAEAFEKELNASVVANVGGKQRRISKLRAIAKQQTNKAAAGDYKATAIVMRALEPRAVEQMDNLTPILGQMRAIHAMHQAAKQNNDRATDILNPLDQREE